METITSQKLSIMETEELSNLAFQEKVNTSELNLISAKDFSSYETVDNLLDNAMKTEALDPLEIQEKQKDKSFKSSICQKGFTLKANMKTHISAVHEGQKPYTCEICSRCFSQKVHLKGHFVSAHEGKQPWRKGTETLKFNKNQGKTANSDGNGSYVEIKEEYHQPTLELKIETLDPLEIREKQREKSFKCNICPKGFTTKGNMKTHVSAVHEGKKSYTCEVCDTCFAQKVQLKLHFASIHVGKQPLRKGPKTLKFNKNLEKAGHNDNESYVEINDEYLLKTSKLKIETLDLFEIRENQKEKPFSCNICQKGFSSKGNMKTHTSVVHEGHKPYRCEVCNRCFSHKVQLKFHFAKVHVGKKQTLDLKVKKQEPFQCNICQIIFSRKDRLLKHISRVHEGENSYKCSVCNGSFNSENRLNQHLYKAHVKKENLQCSICQTNGNFRSESQLWKHLVKTHDSKKPYQCFSCQINFSRKDGLNLHVSRIHAGENPYKCDVCNGNFRTESQLSKHLV